MANGIVVKMNCVKNIVNKLLPTTLNVTLSQFKSRNYSSLTCGFLSNNIASASLLMGRKDCDLKTSHKTRLNLLPVNSLIIQNCGMKVKGKPKLRCKYCYYALLEGVMHVLCDKYPRHKQRGHMPRKMKYGWLLTHAMQSKYRPY